MSTRRPNFIYIGPGKAGSTWLHEILIRHPQIYLTEAKDLYFFDRYYDRGLEWYLSHFQEARSEHLVVGEICQQYLFNPDVPKRMHDSLGADVRLMMTIREPAKRAFSSYLYARKHGALSGSFRDALESGPRLLNPSRYATHLSRYLQYFDRSSVYCAVFDDLERDPQAFTDPLLAWLGVAPMTLDDSLLAAKLPASRARSTRVARTIRDTADWARQRRAATLIGYVKRSPLVHKVLYVPLDDNRPRLSEEDARYVREALEPEIVELEVLLGLELRRRWGWT